MEGKRKSRKRKHSRKPSRAGEEKTDVIEIIFPSQLNTARTGETGLPAGHVLKSIPSDDGVDDVAASDRLAKTAAAAKGQTQDRPTMAKDGEDGHGHIDATYWWKNVTRVLDEAEQERLEEEEMEAAVAAAAARRLHDMRSRGRHGGRRRSSGSYDDNDDAAFKRSIRFAEEHVHKPLSWSILGHQVGQAEAVASEILAGIDPDDMYEHVEGPQRDIRFMQRLRLLRRNRATNDAVEREQARTKTAANMKPETLEQSIGRLKKQLKRDVRMACDDDFVMPLKIACGEPLIFERFRIVRVISRGSNTVVHLAFDMLEERYCALKSESRSANFRTLQYEWRVWRVLAAAAPDEETLLNVLPKCKFFGRSETRQVLCMDLLGPNLEELFVYCQRRFSLKTLLLITDALICSIFLLHTFGFVHGDIRPENICIGQGSIEQTTRLFFIDLGQARKWSHSRLKKHAKLTIGNELVASPNFASLNAHAGFSLSRRDDLISLGYMLIYFGRNGSLPWASPSPHDRQRKPKKSVQENEEQKETSVSDIRKLKRSFTGSQQAWMRLCTPASPPHSASAQEATTNKLMAKHFAPLMSEYMRIATSLEYAEKPPYAKLQRIVRSKFAELTYMDDAQFDWIKNVPLQTAYEKAFGFQNMAKLRADIADWRKSVNKTQQQQDAVGGMLAKQHAFKNLAAIMAARLQADEIGSFAV